METVLITGVNGYIGSRLARSLLDLRERVIGIDLASDTIDELKKNPDFKFFAADITGRAFPGETREADVLIHCAALVHNRSSDLSRGNYFRINHLGTRNILESLDPAKIKQVVYLSTVSIYGNAPEGVIPDEDFHPRPDDFYGESKLAAEEEVRSYSAKHRIPYTILRLAPVYGAEFILNIRKRVYLPGGQLFYRVGNGNQRISLCSINTIMDVAIASLHSPAFFNLTCNTMDGGDYSINEIIRFFRKLNSHEKKKMLSIPSSLPLLAFSIMSLCAPKKAEFYRYQFKKIAQDASYSALKLRKTGMKLSWDIYRTFGL
ncbi:MAG: NAD-dependent epimerase/dehydratase family protein [Syntrophorhabdaceae bacterium]